jgi:hypothetical protein
MSECLLTTREVAEMLGLSSEAVLRRWRAGELPGFRLSNEGLALPRVRGAGMARVAPPRSTFDRCDSGRGLGSQ